MLLASLVWVFFLGLAMGSFLNVVVYRTMKNDSPLKGRSYCDHCGRQLSWKDNIPLISYFFLGGRCAGCKKKISWQYPVIELLTGLLFVWWMIIAQSFLSLGESPWVIIQPVFWFGLAFGLWLLFVFDAKYSIIPDFLSGGLLVWVFLYRAGLYLSGVMRVEDFTLYLVSGLVLMLFFYSLYALTGGRGFGLGDVKLAPSLGLLLGWPGVLVGTMAAFIIGSIFGLSLMSLGKKRFGQTVPFGPFLVIGSTVALIWGDSIWHWYVSLLL
jgi:prepilin signal peptidase PulO-like enzyme (type II secretory pathway)